MDNTSHYWLPIQIGVRHHYKTLASAMDLGISPPQMLGYLMYLWLGAFETTEDGDLWRGTEEDSLRFIAVLSGYPDAQCFVDTLRRNRLLDGWLIHDWLDHVGNLLISKYRTRKRRRLVEIWTKHGRVYGRSGSADDELEEAGGNSAGGMREARGKKAGSEREDTGSDCGPPLDRDQEKYPYGKETKALNPPALDQEKKKSPKGGLGENTVSPQDGVAAESIPPAGKGSLISNFQDSRAQSAVSITDELPCGGVTTEMAFEAFRPVLCFHGILTAGQLAERVRHCRTEPARWVMLFLDKVHAVYRDRNGTTLIDAEDADPVGMTIAGLKGDPRHVASEAARALFIEIILDHAQAVAGGKPRWAGKTSGPAISHELDKRKGKKGKLRS